MPPRTDRAWGEEVVCPDKIPILETSASEPGHGGPPAGRAAGGHALAAAPAAPAEPAEPGADPFAAPKTTTEKTPVLTPELDTTKYLLFRWFDFSVEPGKQYRYRVFLVLKNPNYKDKVERKFLMEPDDAERLYIGHDLKAASGGRIKIDELAAKWSAPTDPIYVPEDVQVLASSVEAPRAQTGEPKGKVQIVRFDKLSGTTVHEEYPVTRGKAIEPTEYSTRQVAVDLKGGELLGRQQRSPGEILAIDPTGELVIHDEVTDEAIIAERTANKPEPPDKGGRAKDGVKPPPGHGDIFDPDVFGNETAQAGQTRSQARRPVETVVSVYSSCSA